MKVKFTRKILAWVRPPPPFLAMPGFWQLSLGQPLPKTGNLKVSPVHEGPLEVIFRFMEVIFRFMEAILWIMEVMWIMVFILELITFVTIIAN